MSNHISVRKSNPEDSATKTKKSTITPWVGAAAVAGLSVLLVPTGNMSKKKARMRKISAGVGGAVTGLAVTALYNARCP